MNIKNLVRDRKMLAIISGVALCATLGVSMASAQTTSTQNGNSGTTGQIQTPSIQGSIDIKQIITSNIKTKFSDAANTAAGAVSNGMVLGGNIGVMQGYLVYTFKVMDGKNNVYFVVIDVGNGKVLYTSPGHSMNAGMFFGMGHSGMWHSRMHGHHMGSYGQQPQGQSSSIPVPPPLGTQ